MNEQNQTTAPGYGPSPNRSGVGERPAAWVVGSRWQYYDAEVFPGSVYRVDEVSPDGKATLVRDNGKSPQATQSGEYEFAAADYTFVGWAPGFPRAPALPAPAVPPAKAPGMWTCIRCGGRHPAVEKLCPTRKPKYGRLIGETRAPDGTPLSALQAVACRRSSEDLKPKPPWVPSCDIDCDIPDAFPVRR